MKRALRWVAPVLLLLLAISLQQAAGRVPELTDRVFSRGIYRSTGRALWAINGLVPFSLAEWIVLLLPILLLPLVAWTTWRQVQRGMNPVGIVLSGIRALLWLAGAGFLIFLLIWGLNYQRPPLGQILNLSGREAAAEEIENIGQTIIAQVNSNWDEARGEQDWTNHSTFTRPRAELYEIIENAFRQEPLLLDAQSLHPGPPKPVYFSRLLSLVGISGVFSPFTGEPNFNREQPDVDLPYSIAHEKAHQRGFAREDEANFIAFLICIKASDAYVRYCGYVHSLRVLAAVRPAVSEEQYRKIVSVLKEGPRSDLRASAEFWRASRSEFFGRAAERANDSYLRANRVASGVKNYGEVVSLILRYYVTYPPASASFSFEKGSEVPSEGGDQNPKPNSRQAR